MMNEVSKYSYTFRLSLYLTDTDLSACVRVYECEFIYY